MGEAARKRGLFCALTNPLAPPANRAPCASIQRTLAIMTIRERIQLLRETAERLEKLKERLDTILEEGCEEVGYSA